MFGSTGLSEKDQLGFKKSQRLAYEAVQYVAGIMQEGWTEKQTADLIETYLKDHGVKSFFHLPFAWFGDRTRFDGVRKYKDFNPTNRIYKKEDVVLLDVAPILDGYVGDVGYSFCKTKNPEFEESIRYLKKLRKNLPSLFEKFQKKGGALWDEIDLEIKKSGYDNIHTLYPFSVLGHRVHHVPLSQFAARSFVPFSFHAFWSLISRGLFSQLLNTKHKGSLKGAWAIEPHIGKKGFGAKFEEILVVDERGARWLEEGDRSQ